MSPYLNRNDDSDSIKGRSHATFHFPFNIFRLSRLPKQQITRDSTEKYYKGISKALLQAEKDFSGLVEELKLEEFRTDVLQGVRTAKTIISARDTVRCYISELKKTASDSDRMSAMQAVRAIELSLMRVKP
jgi:hypothetical protein